jgi:predicted RNA-binding Zn ribbon-like protein
MQSILHLPGRPFESDAAVVDWLLAAERLPAPKPPPRGLAAEADNLCAAIEGCVRAVATGAMPDPDAVTLIDDWLVFAGVRPQLVPGPDGVPVLGERPAADSPRRALGMLALEAARLVGRPEQRSRLRICAGCAEVFFDRSPAGRRRWCSMRTCGNRAKARRHRERQGEP